MFIISKQLDYEYKKNWPHLCIQKKKKKKTSLTLLNF